MHQLPPLRVVPAIKKWEREVLADVTEAQRLLRPRRYYVLGVEEYQAWEAAMNANPNLRDW